MTGTITLAGVDFDALTVAQAACHIAQRPPGAPFAFVVTPNADHLVRLGRDRPLQLIYRDAELCLLDSRVVGVLARLFGLSVPPIACGSDLTAELLALHVRPGERITIVGLSPVWLPALVARYQLAPPAHHHPSLGFDHEPAAFAMAAAFVRDNPARLIFLAIGSPRQERLAAAIAAAGGATGTALCIGASLEYLSGAQRRAPAAMRNAGLEWLFRLALNPRRLARRYLIHSPLVFGLLLRQRLGARVTPP